MDIDHIGQLHPDPRNARKHNPRNIGMVVNSLQEVGAARSIVIDEKGNVLAGNGTIEAAAQAGIERVHVVDADGETIVAVRRSGLTEEQKKRLALFDNRTAELAGWDVEVLQELSEQGDALEGLFSGDELSDLLASLDIRTEGDGGDEFDTTPQDGPTRVQRGELWRIGEHRLLCGDSTSAEDVGRLMGGEKYSLLWTDPPYGVAVGDKNKYLNSIAPSNRVEENLTGDKVDEGTLVAMLQDAFKIAYEFGTAGAGWYVAAPPGPLHIMFGLVLKELGVYRQTLIWVKQNATFAPLGVDYHWRHEPIFYGWLPTGPHHSFGGRKQDTVWEIDRPQASPEHPTMKPIELVHRAIDNSSQHGWVVYDPFLGSGTTLIAAHRTGRKCYGLEIEPKYCDVILRRAEAEGIGPIELVGAGE